MDCGRIVSCELAESWRAASEGGVRASPKTSCAVGRLGGSVLLVVSFPLARDRDPNHDDWYCWRSVPGNGTVPSVADASML